MISRHFYLEQSPPKFTYTAETTGILPDPMRLFTSSRPWLTIEPGEKTQTDQKKILVFADHLFCYRSPNSQKIILDNLIEAYRLGFVLQVLTDARKMITVKKPADFPHKSFSLPFFEFTSEAISAIACQHNSVPANHIYIIDYFGINELLEGNRYRIGALCFKISEDIFFELVNRAPLFSAEIVLVTEQDFDQFLALNPQKLAALKNKMRGITTLGEYKPSLEQYRKLINAFPQTYLEFYNYSDLLKLIATLPHHIFHSCEDLLLSLDDYQFDLATVVNHFPNVKCLQIISDIHDTDTFLFVDLAPHYLPLISMLKIHLHTMDPNDLLELLKAMPNLTGLDIKQLHESDGSNFLELPSDYFNMLTELKLINFDLDTTQGLLNASPNLTKLVLNPPNPERLDCFEHLQTNQLPHLSQIFLEDNCSITTPNAIQHLLRVAPNITLFYSPHSQDTAEYFTTCQPSQLKCLKEIDLSNNSISERDLIAIVTHCVFLQEISFDYLFQINNILASLRPNQLKHLKALSLCATSFSAQTLLLFSRAAPNLTHFEVSNIEFYETGNLPPNSLPNIESLTMSDSSITARQFQQLLAALPNLRLMRINACSIPGAPDLDIQLSLDKLAQLEFKSEDTDFLEYITSAAPFLLSLEIEYGESIHLLDTPNLLNLHIKGKDLHPVFLKHLIEIALELRSIKIINTCPNPQCTREPRDIEHDGIQEIRKLIHENQDEPEQAIDNYLATLAPIKAFEAICDNTFFEIPSSTTVHEFTPYFDGISPAKYRLNVYQPDLNTLNYNDPSKAEIYDMPATLEPIENIDQNLFNVNQGIFNVDYSHGASFTLVSLQYDEILISIKVINSDKKLVPPGLISIFRGRQQKLFQINLPQAGIYTIYYVLATRKKMPEPPVELARLQNKYLQYNTTLKPLTDFKNLQEAVNYINEQKSGVCRHRALAAYAELKAVYSDQVWMVLNELHSFIEVIIGETCYSLDLGGISARIKARNLQNLIEAPATHGADTLDHSVTIPSLDYVPFDETSDIFADNYNALIISNSETSYKSYFNYLLKQFNGAAANIFVARRPEELNTTGNGFNIHGEIIPDHTPLNLWLQNRRFGSILIDIREFNAAEIAQINDLLDRLLPNHNVPATISIILLDSSQRISYGPDFRRRVPLQFVLPENSENYLFSTIPFEPSKGTLEIDLFNSSFWQTELIGTWQLVKKPDSSSLHFQWRNSRLIDLLLDSKNTIQQIIFNNPPQTDLQFMSFLTEFQTFKRIKWVDQTLYFDTPINYYQTSGYDWEKLAQHTALINLAETQADVPYILSDSNLPMFVQPRCYEYSDSSKLTSNESYINRCLNKGFINIICAPGLSENGLAQFLTLIKMVNLTQAFQVRFTAPNFNTIDSSSPLFRLNLLTNRTASEPTVSLSPTWELHEDVYYATRKLMHENPEFHCFDLTSLEASELGRYPQSIDITKRNMLADNSFSLEAHLSDLLKKLQEGETVLLTGSVPPSLYLALTELTLGLIERKFYSGKLIIYTPASEQELAEAMTGKHLSVIKTNPAEKLQLLANLHPDCSVTEDLALESFANLERNALRFKAMRLLPTPPTDLQSVAECALELDNSKWRALTTLLKVFPWAAISGDTGAGKTHFAHHILPQQQVVFNLEEWLTRTSTNDKDLYWILDDFALSHNRTDHFFERLLTLLFVNKTFFYRGKLYPLTHQHKFIILLSPLQPIPDFITQHVLIKEFKPLPLYYLEERLINPLIHRLLPDNNIELKYFSRPILKISGWILHYTTPPAVLITGREIKAMIYFIITKVIEYQLRVSDHVYQAAKEMARIIGKQILCDNPELLSEFDKIFPQLPSIFKRPEAPPYCLEHQIETYWLIHDLISVKTMLSRAGITDLGLGGILLEGPSNIGKSYFINHIKNDYAHRYGWKTLQISASASPFEKEKQLTQVAAKGAIIVSHEYNTGTWPNNFLNFFLMGMNKAGKPLANASVFFATQNSKALHGRHEEDPAIRRRLIKLNLDWKVYQPSLPKSISTSLSPSFFTCSPTDTHKKRKSSSSHKTISMLEEKKAEVSESANSRQKF